MRSSLPLAFLALAFIPGSIPGLRPGDPARAPAAAVPAPVTGLASVAGRVRFVGKDGSGLIPLEVFERCESVDDHTDRLHRDLRVGAARGLRDVVLVLEPADGSSLDVAPELVVPRIDITHARFEPTVVVVPHGNAVEVANQDGCSHVVHTYAIKNDSLNRSLDVGKTLRITCERVEVIKVCDDLHPWMTAWVFVSPSPLFGVSDVDGTFEINGVQPGKYRLSLWHPRLGRSKHVDVLEVDAAGIADLALELPSR